MSRRPATLRTRLAAVTLALVLAPALVCAGAMFAWGTREVRARARERNESLAHALAGEVQQFLEARRALTEQVALVAAVERSRGTEAIRDGLAAHVRANPSVRSLLLLDGTGHVLVAVPPDDDALGLDLSREEYVRRAFATGGPSWAVTESLQSGGPVVALAVARSGSAAVAYLDRKAFEAVLAVRADGTRAAAILSADGSYVAASERRLVDEHVELDLPLIQAGLRGEVRSGIFRYDGRDWMGSVWPVRGAGWAVLVSEPLEDATAGVRRFQLWIALGTAAFAVVAVAASFLLARRVVRPVEALSRSIRRVEAGAYKAEPGPAGPASGGYREVHELAEAFGAMAAAVRSREEALARSERSYRQLVDNSLVGVGRSRLDGTVVFSNDAMARLFGIPGAAEAVGRTVAGQYVDAGVREELIARLRERGQVTSFEARLRGADDAVRTLIFNASLEEDLVTVMALDMTALRRAAAEREQLERQLQHAQKLEAVGRLAGGIAHDFNNLLTAIVGFAGILKEELGDHDPRCESVGGILQSANRAAHLTRSLLVYSRKQAVEPRPVDLCDVIRTVDKLLRRIIGEDVELGLELPSGGLPAMADPGQLEQVLVNLCTNARDAMPGGGTLRIVGDELELDEGGARARELAGAGRYLRVRVIDSGRGVAPEVIAHVFEPFYTTKEAGSGTGLGLSIVYGIMRQHVGHVELESAPGKGTCVTLLLRRHEGPVAAELPAATRQAPRGRETLLLAEDEPLVRSVLRRTLAGAGYEVIEAVDGEEAVRMFAANRERIALCLLDVVMPRKNGREAAEAIRALAPKVPVLLASGYAADVLEERGHGGLEHEVIGKPIGRAELLQRVRERLDRARS
jgi:signal transduction histidine kinase